MYLIKNFLLNNLLKKINIKSLIKENSYENIQIYLLNKQHLKNVDNFLYLLIKFYSKNNILHLEYNKYLKKKFLSIFLIAKFSDIICQNNTIYNEILIDISNKILNLFENNIDYTYLIYYISKFNIIYEKWASIDKRLNTYNLLLQYYKNEFYLLSYKSLEKTNSNLYSIVKENIINENKNIETNVAYMNDKNEMNYFNINKANIFNNKFIEEKIYWNNVAYKLSKKNPNYQDKIIIIELLNNTKHLLKSCVPNRTDIHQIIETNIDCELLDTYLQKNILDHKYFSHIIEFIIEYIYKFQSSSEDSNLELYKKKIFNMFENKMYYKDILVDFFENTHKRLKDIIKEKKKYENINI